MLSVFYAPCFEQNARLQRQIMVVRGIHFCRGRRMIECSGDIAFGKKSFSREWSDNGASSAQA